MLRYQRWLDSLDEIRDPGQVSLVQWLGASQGETHPVQRNRVICAHRLEIAQRRSTTEVVFCVDFKPRNLWVCFNHLAVMLKTQSDPGFCRDRVLRKR